MGLQAWRGWVALGLGLMGWGWSLPALSAERVVFRYSGFERSLSVEELTHFAETGELSSNLSHYVNRTDKDPADLQRALVRPVPMRLVFLDAALNSWVGEMLLDRMGEVIRTPGDQANREALRAALILSASDDDAISLIEVIQHYPTQEVYVEGDRLVDTYYQLSRWSDRAQEFMDMVERLQRINTERSTPNTPSTELPQPSPTQSPRTRPDR
jgi:hypothetical protein